MQEVRLEIKPEVNVKDYTIGVIIMRAQVHKLTPAHTALIDMVCQNHKKVILFLGIPAISNTRSNPLDFATRKVMVQEQYPNIIILPLKDQRSDEEWSKTLDREITYPFGKQTALLYGSRDSFIPYYKGKHKTVELLTNVSYSGTEIRKEVSEEILSSPDFRAGVIHANYANFPTAYPTVDIAAFNEKGELLMAKKPLEDKWRFIGGFVDPRRDKSLELAAKREFSEETGGCEIADLQYVLSAEVDDWRYRGQGSSIMTTLFSAKFVFGAIKASDDIVALAWLKVSDLLEYKKNDTLAEVIMPEHVEFMKVLLEKHK